MEDLYKDENPVIFGYELKNFNTANAITSLIFFVLIVVIMLKSFGRFKKESYWAGFGLILVVLVLGYVNFVFAALGKAVYLGEPTAERRKRELGEIAGLA